MFPIIQKRILGIFLACLLLATTVLADGVTPPSDTPVVPWTRFSIQYAIRRVGQISHVELYITSDGGQTWSKYGEDRNMDGPILVTVDGDGVYGFYTVAVGANMRGDRVPRPGTPPDSFVIVDRTPPEARWISPSEDEMLGPDGITLAWESQDENFGPTPVTIQYSTNEGGSWLPLRENLPAEGRFTWDPPMHAGSQLSFRLIARDRAGNARSVTNHSMIRIDTIPPTARIIRPTLSSTQTIELEYTATDNEGGTGIARIDLYATYDDGRNWRHVLTDTELTGRLTFRSEIRNGPVGLMLSATDRANNRSPVPQPGMAPPFVIMIDTVPPNVQISQGFTGGRDEIRGGEPVVVQWTATDPHIDENSARLEFSANAGRDWQLVAQNLPVNQPYYWTPPADTNSRECFLRVSVSDTFGNQGVAVSQVFGVNRAPPSTRIEDIEGMTGPVEPPIDFGRETVRRPDFDMGLDDRRPVVPDDPVVARADPPRRVDPAPPIDPIDPPIDVGEISIEDFGRIEEGLEGLRPIDPVIAESRYPDRRVDPVDELPFETETPIPPIPADPVERPVPVVDDEHLTGARIDIPGMQDVDTPAFVTDDIFDNLTTDDSEAPTPPDPVAVPDIPDIPSPPPPAPPVVDDDLVRVPVMDDPFEGTTPLDDEPGLPPLPPIDPMEGELVARVPDRTDPLPPIPVEPTQPVQPMDPDPVSLPVIEPDLPVIPRPDEPSAAELLEQATRAWRTRTEYEAARQFTRRVLEIEPNNPEALALYASILTEEGDFEEAVTFAHRAIRQAPDDMSYQMVLGDAHYAYGANLYHAIRDLPADSTPRTIESMNARMLREFDNAETAFRKVAADRSLAKVGFFKLGQVHYFRGNRIFGDVDEARANASLRMAVDQYTRASNIDNIEYREALQIGISLYRLRDYTDSQTWLERSIEIVDTDTVPREAYYYLAVIHLMEGRPEESLPYWRRVTESYPADSRFHQIAVQQIDELSRALDLR